ncbi:MAG: futalosine hydrolase [Chitinophagaceae bacterium]|nr:MAG: futalosine hydrolase [Chitinophagaceae bacterium]
MDMLIVAATEQEILPFLEAHPTADHLITGVGAVMTTYHLTKRLQQLGYDLLIQAGIAGAFNDQLPPASVVVVERECFAGAGIFEAGRLNSLFDAGLWKEDSPFEDSWLINSNPLLTELPWKKVRAATTDFLTDDPLTNGKVYSKYNPDVESMEGAAFHYVSLLENIPFLQIRAISNMVGERDKSRWQIREAITALNAALIHLYSEFKSTNEA